MQINISTSKKNHEVVSFLTKKLPAGTRENVIARIAIGFSLQTGTRFTTQDFNKYDSQGKEYKENILFDDYKDYYVALSCQAYGITKSDDRIPKYIKLHIDHGLERIYYLFEHNPQYTFFDFLTEYLVTGTNAIDDVPEPFSAVTNNNMHISKGEFTGPINIKVGYDSKTGEEIVYHFNDTSLYSNQHIAVAGKSGSGKTQFAYDFMKQLTEQTHGQVNFLFLDFKGSKVDEGFLKKTQTELIIAPEKPFPFNPVSFIDNINEKNKLIGINKFVDIIAKYSKIGKKQQQILKDATKEAFVRQTDTHHPSLKNIYEIVLETVGDKRDILTEIMEKLSELDLFESKVNDPSTFLNKNYYFSLPGDLDNSIRFTSIFLTINYLFNVFSNMGDTGVTDGYKNMRYVLMIDEAHELFKERKSMEILEILLRKMRSYGVSLFLLSQGIAEYNQGDFDFSSECETSFLLPIKDLSNGKSISKYLGLTEKEGPKVMRNIEKLGNGMAVSNMKEFRHDVFKVVQYYSEK